jgi:acyl-coenzyme A synthetase/AMP-(fatty) acid ligase
VHRLVGRQIARGRATATAYLDPDLGTVSYGRLYEAARACASDLRALGAADGERVLVVAEDSAATVSAVLGLWWAGAVPVMASPLSTPSELEFTAADCEARFVYLDTAPVRQRELEERFSALARYTGNQVRTLMSTLADRGAPHYAARPEPRTAPADAPALRPPYAEALVQYTSGSSGKPKGVRHSAAGIIAMLDGFGPVPGLREDDVVLSTARMSFGFGFGSSVLCSLDAGAATALIRGAVDAHVVGAAVRRYRPTVLYSVPRMYAALLDGARAEERDGLTRLRLCVSAGERCPEALAERIVDSLQVDLMICLGATELMHVVLATHPGRPAPGSVGYPVPGTNVTARDDHGRLVPDGTPGRLHVAGPTVALGYIHRPAEQAATFADGGAYTNDLVVRRSDGEFEYLCRTDDVLNLGGYKVAPVEIETVVRAVRGVADCRVVAAVDRDGLEHAVVYAVAAPGAARETVRRAVLTQVRTGLAGHKRPSRVEFLDALPLSANGKVAVHQLRAREART